MSRARIVLPAVFLLVKVQQIYTQFTQTRLQHSVSQNHKRITTQAHIFEGDIVHEHKGKNKHFGPFITMIIFVSIIQLYT